MTMKNGLQLTSVNVIFF